MRRLILIILLTATIVVVVGAITYIVAVNFIRPDYKEPDTSGWETGDVFYSVGDSWKSVAVRSITGVRSRSLGDSIPSHCGLVVRENGEIKLVHESTTAGRIVKESVAEYYENSGTHCLFARHPNMRIDTARVHNVLDSLVKAGIPFDFSFDHTDGSSLYCSELVLDVLEGNDAEGDCAISELRKQKYVYPQDILEKLTH